MKKNYTFSMLIMVVLLLPMMLVCQVTEIKISCLTGRQNLNAPKDLNLLWGQLAAPSNEGAIASQDFSDSTD